MRQLPRILLLTGATVIVIVALLVSGLRLAMPHLDSYRTAILHKISAVSELPITASALQGSWQNFGPTLEIKDLNVGLKDGGRLKIDRVTLALDIWQSLLHARWQFRDLTFWQMHFTTNSPLVESGNNRTSFKTDKISDLFLRQFDHFDLRDSSISFLTPSGQRAELAIPKLTWLNEKTRHRAEGEVSLSSFTGQHGVVQVRLDLSDNNGLLNEGRVWMQADDVDVKPWLGQWMRDNTTLDSARFSLAAWLSLKQGEVYAGDVWLKKGGAGWQGDQRPHRLEVDNVTAHVTRVNSGWTVKVPQTRLTTDGEAWPTGEFSLLWQPENGILPGPDHNEELRVRATKLNLQRLEPLIPLFSPLSPQLLSNWRAIQPRGQLDALALDIPLKQPENSRFAAQWRDLSWQQWKLLPGMEHFSGTLSGGVAHGRVDLLVNDATLPYGDMFRAPLEIKHASGAIDWRYGQQGLSLSGKNLDIQARSLWAKGDFNYHQPANQPPRLDILAGINLTDAADAWRYFPEPLMGKSLVHYLTGAIKGGEVHNATLTFAGDPHKFPFKHNDGMFEVWVPLRNATYEFEPGWPALENLTIDLDFLNDGLWMNAPQAMLGKVQGKNITAVIPDYLKEKLIINGDISGAGPEVRNYFNQSPLKPSLGAALDELQIGGDVSGRLHLDIPLDGQQVRANGEVALHDNTLLIKPLGSTLSKLTGRFSYDNGNLQSDEMSASWFGQPLGVNFNTVEGEKDYQIGVNLKGDWQPAQIKALPQPVASQLKGSAAWNGKVAINLPHQGGAKYQVDVDGDLKNVSSHLPSPLDKAAGSALPVKVSASGNLQHFDLSGSLGDKQRFNSRWLLGDRLRVDRGILVNDSKTTPKLPDRTGMVLNLPPLDGEAWLGLMAGGSEGQAGRSYLPGNIILRTPSLTLAGQQWRDLEATISQSVGGSTQIEAQGREVKGSLTIPASSAWRAHLNYLYYNPQFDSSGNGGKSALPEDASSINFSSWPALDVTCDECWLRGQKFGRMQASLVPDNDTLTLKNGLIDSGNARLAVAGEWVNRPHEQRTSLKGQLSGKKINDASNWFGVNTPLRDAPFNIDYDLHWRSAPWQPSEESLSGVLKSHFGKGEIADVNTGRAGQLLRLISFDALLRKLRLDFSDTFGQGFYFDSINGTAWIENGVMRTDNLLVDGLEADIAMQGKMDLVKRQIDMEAVVAPEISATVGVAAAFVVNPVVGAAVFAASKVLGPLWNKISVLRYHISGPIDKPEINEVLRKPRENSAK
ncbi:AsmA2 domain-containing protein YhdP [Erwiniaceae bacterium BAC15a-03b]|uniref:AsmA2 domain-containing protein YhdP n=1 Tax=Winslowiella arboricola TaxID=2978220 RepID=A0A9J6PHG8_9GAMM|nr:AsmA2 domain-containing protein YhdP [Winslowiella arboricola]MCU5771276.1 AsmA2 domain-containing protein YhdP [Winslowiella arboricola]MCU5776794.1 AsmA2 domain-containing protein YhdP [Winslowiella arboricola]